MVGVHCGAAAGALLFIDANPERVRGAFFFAPALPISPPLPERTGHSFDAELESYEGWAKTNRHYWAQDYRGFLEFFFDRCYATEPHSTKQIEDSINWGLETDPETLAHTLEASGPGEAEIRELLARLDIPLLVIQGEDDRLVPPDRGAAFSALTGAELVELEGAGHCPHARQPVPINHGSCATSRSACMAAPSCRRAGGARAARRKARAVHLVADRLADVARRRHRAELRALHPTCRSSGSPSTRVTHVLEAAVETVHPPARCSPTSRARSRRIPPARAGHVPGVALHGRFLLATSWSLTTSCATWTTGGSPTSAETRLFCPRPEPKFAAAAFLTRRRLAPPPEGGADEACSTAQ